MDRKIDRVVASDLRPAKSVIEGQREIEQRAPADGRIGGRRQHPARPQPWRMVSLWRIEPRSSRTNGTEKLLR